MSSLRQNERLFCLAAKIRVLKIKKKLVKLFWSKSKYLAKITSFYCPLSRRCQAAPGLICQRVNQSSVSEESDFDGVTQDEFYMDADCKWTNGYHFDTALLLSGTYYNIQKQMFI